MDYSHRFWGFLPLLEQATVLGMLQEAKIHQRMDTNTLHDQITQIFILHTEYMDNTHLNTCTIFHSNPWANEPVMKNQSEETRMKAVKLKFPHVAEYLKLLNLATSSAKYSHDDNNTPKKYRRHVRYEARHLPHH